MVKFFRKNFNEELNFQILEIRSHISTLITPFRGISKTQKEHSERIIARENVIGEVFQRFSLDDIRNISISQRNSEILYKKITSKILKDNFNLFIFDITDGFPKERELENLLHILNFESLVNDNLVCIPYSSSISKLDKYEQVFNILYYNINKVYQIYQTFIEKEENILGYVPIFNLAGRHLEEIFNIYISKFNVNSFVIDFGGKHIEMMRSQVSNLFKIKKYLIKEYDTVLFYAFNTFSGRLSKSKKHIPARDFLTIFVGFDGFGPSHKRYNLRREIAEKLKEEEMGRFRIFERKTYTYNLYTEKELYNIFNFERKLIKRNLSEEIKKINAFYQVDELERIKKEFEDKNTYINILRDKRDAFYIVSQFHGLNKGSLLVKKLFEFSKNN
ncbi:MAG: hypothetical protein QW367_01750 [Candidatus Aenigmatarchaeota archaeon]